MRKYWEAAQVLDAVGPRLASELIPAERLALCRQAACSLPDVAVSYYLECRLDDDAQVDFLALVQHRHAALEFRRAAGDLAPAEEKRAARRRLLEFLEAWPNEPNLPGRVPPIWLEYDIDGRSLGQPLASPGFCLEPEYFTRFLASPLVDQRRARELAEAGARRLLGEEAFRSVAPSLARCFAALPRGGSVIHLSTMLARDPVTTKLYVGVPRRRALEYLSNVGWPGSLELVARVLADGEGEQPSTVYLDLCLKPELSRQIGVARSQFQRRDRKDFDPAWRHVPLPETSPEKRAATLAWPGVSEHRIDGVRCWIQRWLDLKSVIDGRGVVRHKAYLGFMPALPPPFS